MQGLFMTAMAVVMWLSGAGIDRINERKAKNQQTQPAQITYVSESAGTSNEPEQATEQNAEPAQEEKEAQPAEPAQAEVPDLTADMVYKCTYACDPVAVLNGIDSAEALCGAYGVKHPFHSQSLTYEKCTKPEAVEEVTAEANKIIDDATNEFEAQWSTQEQQQSSRDVRVMVDMIHTRAKEHGIDLSPMRGGGSYPDVDYQLKFYGRDFGSAWFEVKRVVKDGSGHRRNRYNCEWITQVGDDCSYIAGPRCNALPFCEANKDFPGCEQFLDIYGNCERILADSVNKDEL